MYYSYCLILIQEFHSADIRSGIYYDSSLFRKMYSVTLKLALNKMYTRLL